MCVKRRIYVAMWGRARVQRSRSIAPDSSLGASSGRLLKPPPKRRVDRCEEKGATRWSYKLPSSVRADCYPQCIPQVLPPRAITKQVFNGFGNGMVA